MIRVEKTHLPVAALTHPGMKGKNNEDRFGVTAFRAKFAPKTPILLAVLSDGIGGNRAGEVASEMAVDLISQYAADSDGRSPQAVLEGAIHYASGQIFQQAQAIPEQHGMGATCACAWVAGDRLFTATVGDTRIYLMREGLIRQLSTDHTWIQEALERGLLQPSEVAGHPNAHVIRRYLGSLAPPEVDFRMRYDAAGADVPSTNSQGLHLMPGDTVLLCSDGLTDLVSDKEILSSFQKSTLATAGQRLIDLANQRGGHDNITLIAIGMPVIPAPATAKTSARPRSLVAGCITVVLLAVVAGAVAGGYLLYGGGQPTGTPTPTLVDTITPFLLTDTPAPTQPPSDTPTVETPLPSASPTLAVPAEPLPTVTVVHIATITPGGLPIAPTRTP